jgi:RNA polymerase sigma-70 factor (ECF subfamily)
MESEEVVIEAAKTDPEAFGRLYDQYYQPVFGFLLGRTRNVEVAKDLASETFFQALKGIHRYKPQGKPFKSWLFAIAVAQVGNFYRSRSKYLSVTTEEAPEILADEQYEADTAILESEQNEEKKVQLSRLRRVMKQLNQKQQNILQLRFFSHLSIAEIAQSLSMKEGTVKSHIHRAIQKLHNLMTAATETKKETQHDYARTAVPARTTT